MDQSESNDSFDEQILPALLYFLGRIVAFLALVPNSYTAVGDLPVYHGLGGAARLAIHPLLERISAAFPAAECGSFQTDRRADLSILLCCWRWSWRWRGLPVCCSFARSPGEFSAFARRARAPGSSWRSCCPCPTPGGILTCCRWHACCWARGGCWRAIPGAVGGRSGLGCC